MKVFSKDSLLAGMVLTISCCGFLLVVSAGKSIAQTPAADSGNVNIFKVLCYNVMPRIDKIKALAKRFRWVPIVGEKRLKSAAPPNTNVTSANGWLLKNKGGLYQLMVYRSSLAKNFSVLKNYKNATQFRCAMTALNMSSPDGQAAAFGKAFGGKAKLRKRSSGGVTYSWLPRVSKKSLTMIRLITSPGKPNGVVLMDLLINP